ncbi:hypothetical protein KC909_06060, partial [Candidatus Dojkabacteria bacterium]|nr:hypothetical protein [Candidatus Dojkabacteria bacterium]
QVNIYKDNTGSIPLGHSDLEAAIAALPDVGNEQSTIEFADDNAASGVGALRYTVTRISETDYYHELTLSVDVDGDFQTVFLEGINCLDDRIRRYIPMGEFDGEWEDIELEGLAVMGYALELQDDSEGSKLIVQETFTALQNNLLGVSIGKTLKPDLLEKVGVSSSHAFDTEKSVKPVSLIIFN